jgi:hypothetical protein
MSVIRVDSTTNPVSLNVTRSTFRDNLLIVGSSMGSGAAIGMFSQSSGTNSLTLSFCDFSRNALNTTSDGAHGGAVCLDARAGTGSFATIVDTSFTQNRVDPSTCGLFCNELEGGALWVQCSNDGSLCLQVVRSKFVDNYSFDDGGAVVVSGSGSLFDTVLFEGNIAEHTVSGTSGNGAAIFYGQGCKWYSCTRLFSVLTLTQPVSPLLPFPHVHFATIRQLPAERFQSLAALVSMALP